MKIKQIFSVLLAAALLICVCALSGCAGKKTIDLKDYTAVSFSGYDGSGTARVDIDTDAMLPLFGDGSALWLYDCFSWTTDAVSDTLSNGDILKVKVTYNETMINNANARVINTELSFPVTGLKEKEKLDLSGTVTLDVQGISPECTVTVKSDTLSASQFTVTTESGEELDEYSLMNRKFRSGERITVSLTESAVKNLSQQYLIDNTSFELTVNCDSRYILSAADLSENDRKALDKAAENFVNEKVTAALGGNDRAVLNEAVSAASGLNLGKLYAGCSQRLDKLEVKEFDSAYVGHNDITSWGVTKQEKYAYYLYSADIKYYAREFFDIYDEEKSIVLLVEIYEPRITPDGLQYSKMSMKAVKDIDTAKSQYIPDSMEKLA